MNISNLSLILPSLNFYFFIFQVRLICLNAREIALYASKEAVLFEVAVSYQD